MKHRVAVAVEVSENAKTGPISATYAAQTTCPTSCPFLNRGCYAEPGVTYVGFTTARLNRAARRLGATIRDVVRAEALAISRLTGKRPMRLHVVGDCRTDATAKVLGRAVEAYRLRGWLKGVQSMANRVWTYTHGWREVARASWGDNISVLASCESTKDAKAAMKRGYAASLVVLQHPRNGRAYMQDGIKVVPCPEQTRGVTCTECRLCFDDAGLLERRSVIAFEVHGVQKRRAGEAITQKRLPL